MFINYIIYVLHIVDGHWWIMRMNGHQCSLSNGGIKNRFDVKKTSQKWFFPSIYSKIIGRQWDKLLCAVLACLHYVFLCFFLEMHHSSSTSKLFNDLFSKLPQHKHSKTEFDCPGSRYWDFFFMKTISHPINILLSLQRAYIVVLAVWMVRIIVSIEAHNYVHIFAESLAEVIGSYNVIRMASVCHMG